jgi:hypothetical protein
MSLLDLSPQVGMHQTQSRQYKDLDSGYNKYLENLMCPIEGLIAGQNKGAASPWPSLSTDRHHYLLR